MSIQFLATNTAKGRMVYNTDRAKFAPRLFILERLADTGEWIESCRTRREAKAHRFYQNMVADGHDVRLIQG